MKYQKYNFRPDYRNMVRTAQNQWVDRVPLYEHIVGAKVIEEITGNRPYDDLTNPNENARRRACRKAVGGFCRRITRKSACPQCQTAVY